MHESPQGLYDNINFSILVNKEILKNTLNCVDIKTSAQQATKNEIFDTCAITLHTITSETFNGKNVFDLILTKYIHYFVQDFL